MRTQRATAFLLALAVPGLCGCASSQTVQRPYAEVESALLQRLDTAGQELRAGSAWARIDSRELARCLNPPPGPVLVSGYVAGQRIRLKMEERYDIGGVGGRSLTVDLQRAGARRTRVAVNYLDKAAGFFVFPFAYVNPGLSREGKIAQCLARLEGTPDESDRIPPPPVPPPPERPCRRFQGLTCGPPGSVLPCDAPDGERLECVCEGSVWSCGPS